MFALILVMPDHFGEDFAGFAMIEARVYWVYGVEGVFVDGFETLVIEVDVEVCLFVVFDKELKLLSSLSLLLLVFSPSFLH